jgi:peptidoglycan/xylan/chitin deacetylase (PgdA/CDA1 family)
VLEIALDGAAPCRYEGLERAESRAAAAADLCGRLACRQGTVIREVLGQLRAWAGTERAIGRGGVPMDRSQLEELARHPQVEIGAHTVSHGCLAGLAPPAQREEIGRSKADLEAIAGRPVRVFSYPNGSLSAETPALLRSLGFSGACTSLDGAFTHRGDPYRIPRLWASDVDGPAFRHWLGGWV